MRRSERSVREARDSTDDQSERLVELRVKERRERKAWPTSRISLRGLEMATSVLRDGKVWPSLSSSTHWDM